MGLVKKLPVKAGVLGSFNLESPCLQTGEYVKLSVNTDREGQTWFGVKDAAILTDDHKATLIRQETSLSAALAGLDLAEEPFVGQPVKGGMLVNLDRVVGWCLKVDPERGILVKELGGTRYYADPEKCRRLWNDCYSCREDA